MPPAATERRVLTFSGVRAEFNQVPVAYVSAHMPRRMASIVGLKRGSASNMEALHASRTTDLRIP